MLSNNCFFQFNYISTPKERHDNFKNKNHSFCLKLHKFELSTDTIQGDVDSYIIRASLYDFAYKEFLGKQWNSDKIKSFKKVGDVLNFELNEAIYFHTSLIDESLVLIFEVIRCKSDDNQVSVGWSIFNIFKTANNPTSITSERSSIGIMKGTPRALLLMDDLPERYPSLQKYDKAFIHFTFDPNQAFDQCQYLVPENFLLHDRDVVPGIESSPYGNSNFAKPVLAKSTNYTIERLKIVVEPSLFEFENNFKKLLNSDRLGRDTSTQNKDAGSLKIVERRLRVGVHNGYTFVEDNEIVCLNVHDSKVKSSRHSHTVQSTDRDNNSLKAKNAVEVTLPEDSHFALVFFLEYVVSESKFEENRRHSVGMIPAAQHTYGICWAIYHPFNQQISPVSFMDGIKLELELSGGAHGAPEDVLVYRSELPIKTTPTVDSEYAGNGIKLSALLKTKVEGFNEPIMVVQKSAMAYAEVTMPPAGDFKREPNDENLIRKTQSPSTKSEIYDMQIRQGQQFMMQQRMQQQWYDQRYFQMAPMFLGKSSMSPDETIMNYKDIEPYVMSSDSNQSTRGRTGVMQPLQMRCHAGLGLSRATYANLYAAGFPEFVDVNGDHPLVIEPTDTASDINWLLEEKDSRDCDEVIFQFMAMSRNHSRYILLNVVSKNSGRTFEPMALNDFAIMAMKILHHPLFVFTCFFLQDMTQLPMSIKLNLYFSHSNFIDFHRSPLNAPMILRKMNKDGSTISDPPGTVVKYMLNPAFMKHGERYSYLEYMSQQFMYVDVWDGDSLMLIGSCAVQLKTMCRQGKTSVQMTYELDIINHVELEEGNITSIKGRLHLRMINLGSVSTDKINKMTLTPYPKKGLLVDATEIERFGGGSLSAVSSRMGGSLKNIYKTEDIEGNRLGYSGVVVRPQPAASKHRELAELLEKRSGQPGSVTLSPGKTPLTNGDVLKGVDRDKSRKLSRLKSLLATLPNDYDKSEESNLLLQAKRNDKAEKVKNLQIINNFRAQQKRESIRLMLNGVVQREVTLYPKFGCTEIFEIKIKNHFNADDNIQIEIMDDSDSLAIIQNPFELRALKTLYSITTSSVDGLISTNKSKGCPEMFMRSKESSLIPFKYTNMALHSSQIVQEPSVEGTTPTQLNCMSITDVEKQITFRTSDGKLLSVVRVKIFPQPPAIDQTFRFFHPEQSFMKKLISLPPLHVTAGPNDAIKALTRCSDPEVVTECQQLPVGTPHDVFIKVNCGPHPEVRQFLLAVYIDKFLLKPVQVWHFMVHSQKRIDVVAYQGQTSHFTLLVKGTSNSHRVQVFSSHPDELSVGQIDSNSFTLVAHSTCELNLSLTPLRIGDRTFHVNVVDIDTHKLVTAWSICAICKEPEVSKMFELQMPANGGEECRKKIGFQNPYGHEKRFYLITDRQDLIIFKESILQIGPNKVEYIGIIFLPVINRGKEKIFVFINDEDGRNEETFSLLVNYV